MAQCKRCGSMAINPKSHGRDNTDLDLCDVCFWRKRAESATIYLVKTFAPDCCNILEGAYTTVEKANACLESLDCNPWESGVQEITLNQKLENDSKGYIFIKGKTGDIKPFDKEEIIF